MDFMKGSVCHFGKYAYILSCRELIDKIDTTLVCTVNMKLPPAAS